jgi:hypothetical protein
MTKTHLDVMSEATKTPEAYLNQAITYKKQKLAAVDRQIKECEKQLVILHGEGQTLAEEIMEFENYVNRPSGILHAGDTSPIADRS